MRNLRVLTALIALFFAGVVSAPAQNRTVAVAPDAVSRADAR
jgi:hypothetical protein